MEELRKDVPDQSRRRLLQGAAGLAAVGATTAIGLRSARAAGRRGPVQVKNSQVWTDTSWPLQGCCGSAASKIGFDLGWWEMLRDKYRLNCVRLDTRITNPPRSNNVADEVSLSKLFANVDRYIDNAAKCGMYVILDNHTSCCTVYNAKLMRDFWAYAAPRYRNETHVLYEAQNEPSPWPITRTEPDQLFRDQKMIFDLIRSFAPKRHIIMLTTMRSASGLKERVDRLKGIDWSNASVGMHLYRHQMNDPKFTYLSRLRAAHPVIITEFNGTDPYWSNNTNDAQIWDYVLAHKTSWIRLELTNGGNLGYGVKNAKEWPLRWKADPGAKA
jgi:hypothetical protein